jgi:hypothetical protein
MTSSPAQGSPAAGDEGDELAAEKRIARRALLILDLVFFITMAGLAVLAPCGDWENRLLGLTIRTNADPGGPT